MQLKDFLITGGSFINKSFKRKLIRYSYQLRAQKGLEIGGPSTLFSLRGYFPVYLFAKQIDGANFSADTVWEGKITEGNNYRYYNKTGYQFIREATDLHGIADESYDFVLSCHSLEHVANPLKAIIEWKRVLKPAGTLVLVLPDKRFTFDVNRPYTTMEHLLQDYRQNTDEHDTTHFNEVVQCRPTSPGNDTSEQFFKKLQDNYHTRLVHHHIFGFELVQQMLSFASFKVLYQQEGAPFHLITIAQKSA